MLLISGSRVSGCRMPRLYGKLDTLMSKANCVRWLLQSTRRCYLKRKTSGIYPLKIMLIINFVQKESFEGTATNKYAMCKRVLYPYNIILFINLSLRATMTDHDKRNELNSTTIILRNQPSTLYYSRCCNQDSCSHPRSIILTTNERQAGRVTKHFGSNTSMVFGRGGGGS